MGTTILFMFAGIAGLIALFLWKAAAETRKEAMWRLDIALGLSKMANIALHEVMSLKAGKPVSVLLEEDCDELRRRMYLSPSHAASVVMVLDELIARYGVDA